MLMGWASGQFGILGVMANPPLAIPWLNYSGVGIAAASLVVYSVMKSEVSEGGDGEGGDADDGGSGAGAGAGVVGSRRRRREAAAAGDGGRQGLPLVPYIAQVTVLASDLSWIGVPPFVN